MKVLREYLGDTIREFFKNRDVRKEIRNLSSNVVGYPLGTKVYLALLTQTGANAPVATVLVNTLGGTVIYGYVAAGEYSATLAGAFPATKTALPAVNMGATVVTRTSDDVINITTNADDTFVDTYFQIIVFP